MKAKLKLYSVSKFISDKDILLAKIEINDKLTKILKLIETNLKTKKNETKN